MQDTKISWTNKSWNPTSGCSRVSAGCAHCYAETLSAKYGWTTKPWTQQNEAENVKIKPHKLHEPYGLKEPSRVFTNSMSDLFHRAIPDWYIAAVFAVMLDLPQHTFQVLTKRPEMTVDWHERWLAAIQTPEFRQLHDNTRRAQLRRALDNAYLYDSPWGENIWMGTSVEDNRVLHRVDELRSNEAQVRFISAEPLLGPLGDIDLTGIHWVIVGGESGPHMTQATQTTNPRWMDHAWARELRDNCVAQGVPFFFKQSSGFRTEMHPFLEETDGTKSEWRQFPDQQPANHTITIYTGRIDNRDPDTLDITIKSASTTEGRALAPTWALVMNHKRGQISDQEYTDAYLALLRVRYNENPTPFLDILKRDRVVLACYCPAGAFCHRHIAVDVLEKIAASKGIAVVRGGERVDQPDKPQQMALL